MRTVVKSLNKKIFLSQNRRLNLSYVAGAMIVLGLLTVPLENPNSFLVTARPAPIRANIVFIRTDDQDLLSLEARKSDGELISKKINELLEAQGIKFTNSFVSFALCCPSRVTSLTGQYAHNHKILDNAGYRKFENLYANNNLAVWLQRAGYQTMHLGKYINGYGYATNPAVPPGWDKWFTNFRSVNYYNYLINEEGVIREFGEAPEEYLTDVLTDKAVEYISEVASARKPFFLVVDYYAPHMGSWGGDIVTPAPRHDNLLADYEPTFAPSFNEEDVGDKPQKVRDLPLLDETEIERIKDTRRDGLEALMSVDEGVARIIETLAQIGKLKNTYIIFTSDNGFMFGEHRIPQGKNWPYEESIRVPLLIRGPGIVPGTTISGLVTNVDYAATIIDIAKAVPGLRQDGRSLMPLIANPNIKWRDSFLIETGPSPWYTGMRSDNYKYLEYDNDLDSNTDEYELYNFFPDECRTNGDLYEMESQHANSCYQEMINQFRKRLAELKQCAGENCW